jgi:hypothetical protein
MGGSSVPRNATVLFTVFWLNSCLLHLRVQWRRKQRCRDAVVRRRGGAVHHSDPSPDQPHVQWHRMPQPSLQWHRIAVVSAHVHVVLLAYAGVEPVVERSLYLQQFVVDLVEAVAKNLCSPLEAEGARVRGRMVRGGVLVVQLRLPWIQSIRSQGSVRSLPISARTKLAKALMVAAGGNNDFFMVTARIALRCGDISFVSSVIL